MTRSTPQFQSAPPMAAAYDTASRLPSPKMNWLMTAYALGKRMTRLAAMPPPRGLVRPMSTYTRVIITSRMPRTT